jgi:hypothetical protein
MLGDADLERYRRMSAAERGEIFRQLMDFAWSSLMELPDEERRRRLDFVQREHALSSAALEERLKSLP